MMKIIKVIVDKKPEYCMNCSIHLNCNKGIYITKPTKDGKGTFSAFVPSEDCLLEEVKFE
ncbi:MAG TPA: hypothetical protein GX708_24700 [Gallicola sp.]|nr:hypothetical protein [Gallicola sp.]